jgi:tRNA pseudouridine38-40 synthase
MRLALGVEYDGAAFCGWQIQPNQPTVQAALETALSSVAHHPVSVTCAGRTDSGVHATGQVVHFNTTATRPLTAWVRGVNAHLPAGVAVLWAQEVGDDFHARFSALSRSYTYALLVHPVRPALMAGKLGWYHQELDLSALQAALAALPGEHDFSSFRAVECQAQSPVRTLLEASVTRQGQLLVFSFRANAFLQHMIRNLMGALVWVGAGRQPASWMGWLLEQRNRNLGPPTFMPEGLYLSGVEYEPNWRLPKGNRLAETMSVLANRVGDSKA